MSTPFEFGRTRKLMDGMVHKLYPIRTVDIRRPEAAKFDRVSVLSNGWNYSSLRTRGRLRRNKYAWSDMDGCEGSRVKHLGYCGCASNSLAALDLNKKARGIYVDYGCGDSPDATIAKAAGFKAFAVDLCEPSDIGVRGVKGYKSATFLKCDMVICRPFKAGSVSHCSCHAALDLVEKSARLEFFCGVFASIKRGGTFALTLVNLKSGYGCIRAEELERLSSVGFKNISRSHRSIKSAILVEKP